MPAQRRTRVDAQVDFSGGANPFTHPVLLRPNEVQVLENAFARVGGGAEARKGYKYYDGGGSSDQGTAIFEMGQSTGTILTFENIGPNWYDETMQSRFRVFNITPAVGDAVYFGAREKFNQLILFMLFAFLVTDWTFVWEVSDGAGGWIDKTASIVESVANSKKWAGAVGEWLFSWPDFADWLPQQVETRGYQYWLRSRVSVAGTATGNDAFHGQRRVRGDWVGRRHLMTADTGHLWEWPGLTLTKRAVETWTTGQRIARTNAAVLNDYLYYSSSGQRPLRRWNGSRGTTRAGGTNVPVDAGLTVPAACTLSQPTANPNAFPTGGIWRYRLSFEFGPEGILGESRPSASTEITMTGVNNIRVTFAAAKAFAATSDVYSILVYRTVNDLSATTIGSYRDRIEGFQLVKRIIVEDADWTAGFWEDTYVAPIEQSPIAYTNTPPFYPKGIVAGGDRLWIWNDLFVAWSDIGRGDSWDPSNIAKFSEVRGIVYRDKRLYVFQDNDISYIDLPAVGLPDIQYFWRGLGNVEPDAISVYENQVHFVSRDGPARIIGRRVELTGKYRVLEDSSYWGGAVGQRRIASAAGFQGRIWIGVDKAANAGPGLGSVATLDLLVNERGAWSRHPYPEKWGTFGVVHATLDHPLARQPILCAFADGSFTSDYFKLAVLEYGTTDKWTTLATDGTKITTTIRTRPLIMQAADRFKEYHHIHAIVRMVRTAASGVTVTAQPKSISGRTDGKILTYTPSTADVAKDITFALTEAAGGGRYRDTAPYIEVIAISDTGYVLVSWLARAVADRWRII